MKFKDYLSEKMKDPIFKKEYGKIKLSGYCDKCGCEVRNGECVECRRRIKRKEK